MVVATVVSSTFTTIGFQMDETNTLIPRHKLSYTMQCTPCSPHVRSKTNLHYSRLLRLAKSHYELLTRVLLHVSCMSKRHIVMPEKVARTAPRASPSDPSFSQQQEQQDGACGGSPSYFPPALLFACTNGGVLRELRSVCKDSRFGGTAGRLSSWEE